MASIVGIELTGDKEAIAMLAAIEGKVQKKLVRQALRKSAKRLKDEVTKLVSGDVIQVRTGTYSKAINAAKIRASKRKRNLIRVGVVMPTREVLGIKADAKGFFPAALEYGTPTAPARPHWRPAVDNNAKDEFRLIGEDLRRGVEREAAKAKKV